MLPLFSIMTLWLHTTKMINVHDILCLCVDVHNVI